MNIFETKFYFYSGDLINPDLPSGCKISRELNTNIELEALLVKFDKKISNFPSEYIVMIPYFQGTKFDELSADNGFTVYVIDGTNYAEAIDIDLTNFKNNVLDRGSITTSEKYAIEHQVK